MYSSHYKLCFLIMLLWLMVGALWGQSRNILRVEYSDSTGEEPILVSNLDEVSVTAKRKFSSDEERKKYYRYRYYASKVYPYATQAIRIFREVEESTKIRSKRQHRKHLRVLQKELRSEFEDPLKDLTKTQGRILIHMIEKELDTPLHFLIKDLRNGLHAGYWSTLGSLNGYHLKKGYIRGEDAILDMVLDDFDISYD